MTMRILQVNTHDIGGGAERIASDLHDAYRVRGHEASLVVGKKRGDSSDVLTLYDRNPDIASYWRAAVNNRMLNWFGEDYCRISQLAFALGKLADPRRTWDRWNGREDFNFPVSRNLMTLTDKPPKIVHFHNLHGDYFDLRSLSHISQNTPTILTLHDEWLLTGHCAYSIECPRWEVGCGQCPDLDIYPAIRRDSTAFNWKRKRDIYRNSRLYISTPCNWLMQRVERSMLSFHATRVIHNGVNTSVFRPIDKRKARQALDLPLDTTILLHVAKRGEQSRYKDNVTIEQAVTKISREKMSSKSPLFLRLGGEPSTEAINGAVIKQIPYQSDTNTVAYCYQAADVFMHAAHADTFPTTVLEALACGIPVVTTNVGGASEQVEDGETGYLVPPGDHVAMASRVLQLLSDPTRAQEMGRRASEMAQKRFNMEKQVDEYLEWYREVIDSFQQSDD